MQKLFLKLKRLKPFLKNFNEEFYGGISNKVADIRKQLKEAQVAFLTLPVEANITRASDLSQELESLSLAEESFFRQKSWVYWIKEGDQNTSYFHKVVAANNQRNKIHHLVDSAGNHLTSFS
ncbi:hypothetical protein PTKIN_Ptkin15bG0073500 [Pterospermum kingtungense]